jgi:hypothetical protein
VKGRPRQELCRRGHQLSEARVTRQGKGWIKRECRKCKVLRNKMYYGRLT